MCNLFFVYGTLKRGMNNHYLLSEAEFVGEAISANNYSMRDCGFPFACPNEEGFKIKGEIYRTDNNKTISYLDSLEGNGKWYTRSVRKFLLGDSIVYAWIYEMEERLVDKYPYANLVKEGNNYAYSY